MNLLPVLKLIQNEINQNKTDFFISASRKIVPSDEGYEELFENAEIIREEFLEISNFVLDEFDIVDDEKLKLTNQLIENALGNKYKVDLDMNSFGGRGIEDFYIIKGVYVSKV